MTKNTALSIIAVFGLLSILCGGVAGFFLYPHVYPCNSNVVDVKVEVTDSFAPNKDTVAKVWSAIPKKTETRTYKGRTYIGPKTALSDTEKGGPLNEINGPSYGPSWTDSNESSCLDTNIYKNDTFAVDNFRATSTAYITNNELIKLQVEWINLQPELWKIKRETITVAKKQSVVKVYTGLYGGVAIQNKTVASYHGGIGLDAIISDRHLIGLQGGLNSSMQMEFGVRFSEKLRLKK